MSTAYFPPPAPASGLPTTRSHRTALVIDVRNGVNSQFRERYNRLLQSVNGPNIKVDVFTLRGNSLATGPALVPGKPEDTSAVDVPASPIDLNAWAAGLGYDQLIVTVAPSGSAV